MQSLDTEQYAALGAAGISNVCVYQETYHEVRYPQYHPAGKKSDFRYRLETPDRIAQAGIEKIGIGALLGLEVHSRHCISAISNAAIDKRAIPSLFRVFVLQWEGTILLAPSTTRECSNSFWLFASSISISKSPSPLVSRKPSATMCSP